MDAREPPSQLQEALKESTKVDTEYNLPTWVPKTRVNMTKRRSGNIQGKFKEHSGTLKEHSGTFREHSVPEGSSAVHHHNLRGNTARPGNIQGTFKEHARKIQ